MQPKPCLRKGPPAKGPPAPGTKGPGPKGSPAKGAKADGKGKSKTTPRYRGPRRRGADNMVCLFVGPGVVKGRRGLEKTSQDSLGSEPLGSEPLLKKFGILWPLKVQTCQNITLQKCALELCIWEIPDLDGAEQPRTRAFRSQDPLGCSLRRASRRFGFSALSFFWGWLGVKLQMTGGFLHPKHLSTSQLPVVESMFFWILVGALGREEGLSLPNGLKLRFSTNCPRANSTKSCWRPGEQTKPLLFERFEK